MLPFCVYGRLFYVSYETDNEESWLELDNENAEEWEIIKTEEELVNYICKSVERTPLSDETILFDVKNAVVRRIKFLL